MKDIHTEIKAATALPPAVYAATTTGDPIDLHGFNAAELIVSTGAIAGAGDYTVTLEDSPTTTGADFAAVSPVNLRGALPASLAASSTYKLGYIGGKRYVRAVITKNGGTSIAASAVVMTMEPHISPVV